MKLRMTNKPPVHVLWGMTPSPAGKLVVGVTDKGEICRISFLKKGKADKVISQWKQAWPKTKFTNGAVLKNFISKPVLLVGTPFQQSVWRIMVKIPPGSVTTYGAIAACLGKSTASRAVGGACGANPVPYLVPCHRVIAAHGGLGGFSGGLDVKKLLLKSEKFAIYSA